MPQPTCRHVTQFTNCYEDIKFYAECKTTKPEQTCFHGHRSRANEGAESKSEPAVEHDVSISDLVS